MYKYYPEVSTLLVYLQILTAFIAILNSVKLKNTYWIWFIVYLVYIAILEKFGNDIFAYFRIDKHDYFAFISIPIEYIFFFWLYAVKSLKNLKLFYVVTAVFLSTFIPIDFYQKIKVVYSVNLIVGSLLLMILVFLEFRKQISDDNILNFKNNRMFYINIGVLLFYVGTTPFMGLYNLLLKEPTLWSSYYLYFLISNCLMYSLFSASFLCKSQKS